ncbi:hypothetical protein ADN01_08640, partial [Levilinea saccharolytica]
MRRAALKKWLVGGLILMFGLAAILKDNGQPLCVCQRGTADFAGFLPLVAVFNDVGTGFVHGS